MNIRKNPTFLVIGAAKCGTTSLCQMLSEHPEVCFSNPKEVRYFSHEENFRKGWKWYVKHFRPTKGQIAIGEGSVHYSMRSHSPKAAERIAEALPNIKVIYLVRNPLDRTLSHYRMYERSGDEKFLDFEADLLSEKYFSTLLEPSMYWLQLSEFRQRFTDDKIHLVFLEDLISDPETVFSKCCHFLGVSELPPKKLKIKHLNKNSTNPKNKVVQQKTLSQKLFGFLGSKASKRYISASNNNNFHGNSIWNERTHQFVVNNISNDMEKFLLHARKPLNFWDLDLESANKRMQVKR